MSAVPLHLTKVGFGCTSVELLAERLASRGGIWDHPTRYLPKRHEEIAGGSLFWIIKHQLIGRTPILGFGDAEGGRAAIRMAPELILVQARPKRAHQGWRYLEGSDAPLDLGDAGEGVAEMPAGMIGELAAMGLI